MKKLHKLLLKSFAGPFAVSFIISIFFFEMQFVWLWVDELMGKGLNPWLIVELLFYFSANLINFALPMSVLMASLITLGNLAEHYELAAMKSGGLSLQKILLPLIVTMVFITVGAFYVANNLWPRANLKFKTLLYSIQQKEPTINLEENVFYNGIPGVSIRVDSKNPETNEMFDVIIYDHRGKNKGNTSVIRAERGTMEQTDDGRFLILTLHNGNSYDEQTEPRRKRSKVYPHIQSTFGEMIVRIDLAELAFDKADEDLFRKAEEMMTINQLQASIDTFNIRTNKRIHGLQRYFSRTLYLNRDSLPAFENTIAPNTKISEPQSHQNRASHSIRESIQVDPDSTWLFGTVDVSQQLRILDGAKRLTRQQKKHLEDAMASMNEIDKRRREFKMEFHRKFFFAVSCMVLFFIGAPLGAIIRKGGIAWPAVIGLVCFVVYYVLSMVGERMAKAGSVDPWLGMWLSSFVLIPLGAFLTYKATRDSAIMDKDFYLKILRKIVSFFKRNKPSENTPAVS